MEVDLAMATTPDADGPNYVLSGPVGDEIDVSVKYSGVPGNGLRLIQNIHGERTAFSENWATAPVAADG